MWWLGILGGLLLSSIGGCARFGATPIASYGPYQGQAPDALLQRTADALTTRGYAVQQYDPQRGQLVVQARTRAGFRASMFRVQVYREGWIQLVPEGPYVRSAGQGQVSMPSGLVDEYVALAAGLLPSATPAGYR